MERINKCFLISSSSLILLIFTTVLSLFLSFFLFAGSYQLSLNIFMIHLGTHLDSIQLSISGHNNNLYYDIIIFSGLLSISFFMRCNIYFFGWSLKCTLKCNSSMNYPFWQSRLFFGVGIVHLEPKICSSSSNYFPKHALFCIFHSNFTFHSATYLYFILHKLFSGID